MDHGGASDKIFQQGFEYIVQTIGPGSSYHAGTLDMIRKTDPEAKKVAFAYEDDEFAKSVMGGALAKAKDLGLEIVFERIQREFDIDHCLRKGRKTGADDRHGQNDEEEHAHENCGDTIGAEPLLRGIALPGPRIRGKDRGLRTGSACG